MPSIDQLRGKVCENTALKYFLGRGYQCVMQNTSLYGVEVDLLLKKEDTYYIVEVKSDNLWRREHPLSSFQKKRLEKVAQLFSDYTQKSTRLWIAFVNGKKVSLYSLDGAFIS